MIETGGDGTGDTLNFDSQGVAATDNGTTITVAGLEPVTYANFETINILNGTPTATPGAAVPTATLGVIGFVLFCHRRK